MEKTNKFYSCQESSCNKKYKRSEKLIEHMLKVHNRIITENDIGLPTILNKDINQSIKNEKKEKELDLLRSKIKQQEELDKYIKEKAEKDYEIANIEKIREIKEGELKLQAEKLKLEQMQLEFEQKCKENALKNQDECCICMENLRNTVVNPCGHLAFCYCCIEKLNKCPMCNQAIQTRTQIFKS